MHSYSVKQKKSEKERSGCSHGYKKELSVVCTLCKTTNLKQHAVYKADSYMKLINLNEHFVELNTAD